MTASEYEVSLDSDKNVLKIESGYSHTIPMNILKISNLYTLKE